MYDEWRGQEILTAVVPHVWSEHGGVQRAAKGREEKGYKISLEVASFNTATFPNEELKTGILQLDDTNSIIMVDHFNEEDRALLYHDMFKAQQKINAEYPSLKFDSFVISKTNFNVLYQTKELDTYKRFYTSHY